MYGDCYAKKREIMYEEITSIVHDEVVHVLLMGDFSEIISIEEKRGQKVITTSMRKFSEFIQGCQLIDVELKG